MVNRFMLARLRLKSAKGAGQISGQFSCQLTFDRANWAHTVASGNARKAQPGRRKSCTIVAPWVPAR